jgi:hypothetical protein
MFGDGGVVSKGITPLRRMVETRFLLLSNPMGMRKKIGINFKFMIDYISKDNLHAPVIAMIAIPRLLFADDLAFSFTINSLQKTIDQVIKYCREWKLKCNLHKTTILLCKKCGTLKNDEKWFCE